MNVKRPLWITFFSGMGVLRIDGGDEAVLCEYIRNQKHADKRADQMKLLE
jgi:hypothetical protein